VGIVTVLSVLLVDVGVYVLERAGVIELRILPEEQLNYTVGVYTRHSLERSTRRVRISDGRTFPINAHGMRGPETTLDKPANTTRIMIYGGSHVFDQNISGFDDWPRQVERKLHERGMTGVEVLNVGTPGHASTDAVGKLLTEGHHFQPDYLLLDYGWNDLKYFASGEPVHIQQRVFQESYRNQYYNRLDRMLCRTSRLYLGGRWAVQGVFRRLKSWGMVAGAEGMIVEQPVKSTVGDHGLKQYELNVRTFLSIAQSIGAKPVLLAQPTLIRCDNTPEEQAMVHLEYVHMTHGAVCKAFEDIHRVVKQVGAEMGVPVIDVASQVSATAENFTDAVHTTELGSARIAAVVSSGLAEILTAPAPVDVGSPAE